MKLSLAEEYLLLAIRDEKGTFAVSGDILQIALAGAVTMDLLGHKKVDVENKLLHVVDSEPSGDPILDNAIEVLLALKKPKKIKNSVEHLSRKMKSLTNDLLDSLVSKGILRHQEGKVLWVFPDNRYPPENEGPEAGIRQELHDVVLGGSSPDLRIATLISFIQSCDLTNEVFEKPHRREARKRMKQLSKEFKLASDVNKAVVEAQEAVAAAMVAIMAASVVTTSVSS